MSRIGMISETAELPREGWLRELISGFKLSNRALTSAVAQLGAGCARGINGHLGLGENM